MALLQLEKLSLDFGGLRALSDLELEVDQGEVVSLIGPNGAGKTSVFNVITGLYEPSSGAVWFAGKPLAGLKPHQVTQLGVARTFQSLSVLVPGVQAFSVGGGSGQDVGGSAGESWTTMSIHGSSRLAMPLRRCSGATYIRLISPIPGPNLRSAPTPAG